MNREEYLKSIKDVIYLTECAVNNHIPTESRINKMNLEELHQAAKDHMLTAVCAMVLESAGVIKNEFTQDKAKAIRKNTVMDVERKMILERFEAEGIWYMPLKGSVLSDLYPKYGMRQMSDNDILFDSTRADDVRRIMESLGFTTKRFGRGNHDVYVKPPVSNFEMHTSLFSEKEEKKLWEFYNNIKDKLIKDSENNFGFHFSSEDFYIYITAHEYKHYYSGGMGLRSLLDTYIFLTNCGDSLDMGYIEAECGKLGIEEFERQIRNLAMHLFKNQPITDDEHEMLRYIIFSGTYGTYENSIDNKAARYGKGKTAKIKYSFSRLLFPIKESDRYYKKYSSYFPWFYEKKSRLPLLFFYRLGRAVTIRRKKSVKELKILFRRK